MQVTRQIFWVWAASMGVARANNGYIDHASSSVPASIAPGQTVEVRIKAVNNGHANWTAHTAHRLGAQANNTVAWSGFRHGGFSRTPTATQRIMFNE